MPASRWDALETMCCVRMSGGSRSLRLLHHRLPAVLPPGAWLRNIDG